MLVFFSCLHTLFLATHQMMFVIRVEYNMGALKHFAPWDIFCSGVIETFCPLGTYFGLGVLKYFHQKYHTQIFQYPHIIYDWHTLLQPLSKNRLYFFFLIFWHAKIPPSVLLVLILHAYFFKCFMFFKFIMPSQKSDANDSIRIIFIKIIIKINIIMIYINYTILLPILLQENTISPESSLK